MRLPLLLAPVLALAITTQTPAAFAQAEDPAAATINTFDHSLLDVMKRAKALGPKGRYEAFKPVIEQAFDLPVMARFAVGTTWSSLNSEQQAALTKAFTRMTVATYAHNFDGFNGETISLEKVDTRGPDKLVHTRLHSAGSTTELAYRMRQSGGGAWKVIDVYYNSSVSSLLGQRSEFASTLASGGAPALVQSLDRRADTLLQGK